MTTTTFWIDEEDWKLHAIVTPGLMATIDSVEEAADALTERPHSAIRMDSSGIAAKKLAAILKARGMVKGGMG